MSYSRRQLEALGEPLGDSVTYKKLGGGYVAGFGGDSPSPQSQPSSTSQTTSNIPDWAIPYATKNLGNAEALTDINQNPYQTYKGERVAGFTDLQKKSQANIAGMQTAPQLGQATGLSQTAGLGGLMAGQNYQNMATNPNTMSQYMSPYQQNVTDFQKQQAVMDYGRQLPGLSAAAIGKGAFGGNRQAIVESEAQRNLQNQLAGIQATGSQNAFQNAQQAQQFGANLGLQGFDLAGRQAATLGQLGQTQYGQQMGINAAQQQAGAQQQAQEQQGLSNAYQDFLNKQNNPYKQIGFMSDILRGTPTSGGAQSIYQAPPNTLGMGIGLGTAALNAIGRASGGIIAAYREGGSVRNFAEGGMTDPSTELAARSKTPPSNTAEALAKFMLPMIQRLHQPAANPQNTTVAEDMAREILARKEQEPEQQEPDESGIASLPADNIGGDAYNRGGIVAFQVGGAADNYLRTGYAYSSPNPEYIARTPAPSEPVIDNSSAGKYADLLRAEEDAKARYTPMSMEEIAASNKQERERAGITGQLGDLRQAQLEKDQSGEEGRKDRASKNFWITAGLNMAAEASKRGNPTSGLAAILQPASVGAQQAMPGYIAEQDKLRTLTEARNKEMSDIQNSRRAEASGLVALNQNTKDKQDARIAKMDERILGIKGKIADSASAKEAAIAGKAPDAQTAYARAYVNSQIAQGSKVDPVILYGKGVEKYVKENRAFDPRYAGIAQQGIASENTASAKLQELRDDAISRATIRTEKELDSINGMANWAKYTALDNKNKAENIKNKNSNLPTNNYEKYTESVYERHLNNLLPKGDTRTPAPRNALPDRNAPPAAAPATEPKKYSVTTPRGETFGFDTPEQARLFRERISKPSVEAK